MNDKWEKINLKDISDIIMGQSPKSEFYNEDGAGLPFFQGCRDFGELYPSKSKWCTKNLKIAEKNDVLMSVRAPVGDLNIAMEKCIIGRGLCALRTKLDNDRFLYYLLKGNIAHLVSLGTGTVYKAVNKKTVTNFELLIPSLDSQKKISGILSAYDDLIGNNNQRIQKLEQIARTIYREWFVKFRFPGHEDVNMVESELGISPEGWEIKKLGDLINIHRGKSYKSSELVEEGGMPFVNLKCVDRQGGFREEGLKRFNGNYQENQIVSEGDIVIAVTDMTQKREIIGRAALIPKTNEEKMIISLDLVKIEPKNENFNLFIYGFLRYTNFGNQIKEFATGVNVLHLNPIHIANYPVISPPNFLIDEFVNYFSHIYILIDLIRLENKNLRHTRDLLLPKLISGEIDVENLDINTEGIKT